MNVPLVVSQVVENDLCIGCGLCTSACPSNAIEMKWSEDGFLIAAAAGECENDGSCLSVCPFDPTTRDSGRNETVLARKFLGGASREDEQLGRYIGLYAGHSLQHRLDSSSGGVATYVLGQLLQRGIVDHVISVKSSDNGDSHYEYAVSSSLSELKTAAQTRYYPVTLATVLPRINNLQGSVAIVGVACFIKAVRLAQMHDSTLRTKIPFLVGIICGGIKSSFFTDYMASRIGIQANSIVHPQYRIKNPFASASDYSFGCTDLTANVTRSIPMRMVGDMWGTGLFKANACDFCDDVVTELADVSLGDAWLDPYRKDGCGANVVITRSSVADLLIQDGINGGDLVLEELSRNAFVVSQQGSFNHRRDGLGFRMGVRRLAGLPTPIKRFVITKVSLDVMLVQMLRMWTRSRSIRVWRLRRNAPDFDHSMRFALTTLRLATKIARIRRRLLARLGGRRQ